MLKATHKFGVFLIVSECRYINFKHLIEFQEKPQQCRGSAEEYNYMFVSIWSSRKTTNNYIIGPGDIQKQPKWRSLVPELLWFVHIPQSQLETQVVYRHVHVYFNCIFSSLLRASSINLPALLLQEIYKIWLVWFLLRYIHHSNELGC